MLAVVVETLLIQVSRHVVFDDGFQHFTWNWCLLLSLRTTHTIVNVTGAHTASLVTLYQPTIEIIQLLMLTKQNKTRFQDWRHGRVLENRVGPSERLAGAVISARKQPTEAGISEFAVAYDPSRSQWPTMSTIPIVVNKTLQSSLLQRCCYSGHCH